MRRTSRNKVTDDTDERSVAEVSPAAFKRIHASVMKKYGKAFEMLAAYDRGEIPAPGRRKR